MSEDSKVHYFSDYEKEVINKFVNSGDEFFIINNYLTQPYEETISERDDEIDRLNNIISEALGIANERINYYYHNKNDELLKEWEEIFEKLVKRDTELKGDNK